MDLSKLKPRVADQYPPGAIKRHFERHEFKRYYEKIIGENFGDDYNPLTRLFDNYDMVDQYGGKHLLPFFLSKVTNPDQSILLFDEDGNPRRGLRTFGEIAHYVRCIPYKGREGFAADTIWCTPDFLMT